MCLYNMLATIQLRIYGLRHKLKQRFLFNIVSYCNDRCLERQYIPIVIGKQFFQLQILREAGGATRFVYLIDRRQALKMGVLAITHIDKGPVGYLRCFT